MAEKQGLIFKIGQLARGIFHADVDRVAHCLPLAKMPWALRLIERRDPAVTKLIVQLSAQRCRLQNMLSNLRLDDELNANS